MSLSVFGKPGCHLLDLTDLCFDDFLCKCTHLLVFAVLKENFSHVDGALVVG